MKWVLLSIGIWSDGAYIFTASSSYDSKEACQKAVTVTEYISDQKYIQYMTGLCVPAETAKAFLSRGRI